MTGRRTFAALVTAVVIAAWASYGHALDRAGAIEVAKKQVRSQCNAATLCTFDAKLDNNKWYVRVDFAKSDSPNDKAPRGDRRPAVFVIDQTGRVVGRIEGK